MFFGLLNSYQTPHFWVCILLIALRGAPVKPTTETGKHVAWVDIYNDAEALLRRPEPAGLVDGVFTFLCKAQVPSGRWKPGALIVGNVTQLYCHIGDFGAHEVRKFQMLHVPRSTISWIPYSDTLQINPIFAGTDGQGQHTYSCRVWNGTNLYVGHFCESNRQCYFAQGDGEMSTTSGIEVLTVNAFARAFFSQMYSCNNFANSDL